MTSTVVETATQVEEQQPLPVRNAIAVLVARFPRIDETYILREINELERQGQPVVLIPLLRQHSLVIHEEAKPWLDRALYLPLMSWKILLGNVRVFAAAPGRYLRLLAQLVAGTIVRPRTLVRTLALFPKSAYLARILPGLGVKHVHSHFATHATTMSYIIASLSEVTFSFTVHGPDVFVHRLLLRQKLAKAKFVRVISTFNKAFLSALYPAATREKLEVIHMGLNPDVYADAAEQQRRDPHQRTQILSVASLLPNKAFPLLIDACARLIRDGVDIECTIVGDGPLRDVTQAWIDRHGMSERIHLTGVLPQHEVARLMGSTDIFVMPSIIANDGQMDGIPMSLMEAMAAGRPVVASSISGIPELVQNHVSGILIDATHADRIAASVRKLVDDPALREAMGRAGQHKVRREFNVRTTAAAFIRLLDRHEHVDVPLSDAIAGLDWSALGVRSLGVRRVQQRTDSTIAHVAITDGTKTRDVIVKRHSDTANDTRSAPEIAWHEYGVLRALAIALGDQRDETGGTVTYTVPQALLVDEGRGTVVMELAPGRPLDVLLRKARRRRDPSLAVRPLRRAGTWLRLMQERTRVDEDGRHYLTALVLLALRDVDVLAAVDRTIRRNRQAIVDRLHDLEARVADAPLAVVGHHGDFWPGNIFIGDSRVVVIDFEGFREGLPLEDVAYLLSYIELLPLFGRHCATLRNAFLDGYLAGAPLDTNALELFRLINALKALTRNVAAPPRLVTLWTRRTLRNIILRSAR